MKITHDTQLTSSEICFLWGIYLGDTLYICVNKYFLQHIQAKNIKTIVEHTLNPSQQHVEISAGGAGNYGVSISTSMRSDLTVDYLASHRVKG